MMGPATFCFQSILNFWSKQFPTSMTSSQGEEVPADCQDRCCYKQCQRKPNNNVPISCVPCPPSGQNQGNDEKQPRGFTWRRHTPMIDAGSEETVCPIHTLINNLHLLKNCFISSESLLVRFERNKSAMMSALC